MNDLIFITHCCFHMSLQMEITDDNINVSSDDTVSPSGRLQEAMWSSLAVTFHV